jgi:hypothetical protein
MEEEKEEEAGSCKAHRLSQSPPPVMIIVFYSR